MVRGFAILAVIYISLVFDLDHPNVVPILPWRLMICAGIAIDLVIHLTSRRLLEFIITSKMHDSYPISRSRSPTWSRTNATE